MVKIHIHIILYLKNLFSRVAVWYHGGLYDRLLLIDIK